MTHSVPDQAEETLAELIDNVVPTRDYQMLPMVGLGGSAGAIPPLREFFEAMPADSGFAFVVVMHLSPEHESVLAEVLQHSTAMPVVQVQETARVEPNVVYVIPPGRSLHAVDGSLSLGELGHRRGRHVAVDLFFRTLADTHGPHATAIVLSGIDGDGAIGIKRIKERGGLTIAQDPALAEQGGMPNSAIGTGMVDWVLAPADMPERLIAYHRLETRLRLPPEEGPQPAQAPVPPGDTVEAALRDVLNFVRMRTGRDFSYYKRATILRRIGRRMQVNGVDDLPGYLECLRTRPGEAAALLQDLLISVTNFFRDARCFAALTERLPQVFAGKRPGDMVRVWVAGCATGEEAYSVAMMLNEHARTLDAPPLIQVFATDLDDQAIQFAREGIYPLVMEADVSEERLRRYFMRESRGYRVRREIRETVLFATHDLLKDSPFSRLDLISCRNLMIYLEREAQSRLFHLFHFALRPEGLLFLGSSESAEDAAGLFSALDKKHRLYCQRPAQRAGFPMPKGAGSLAAVLQAQAQRGGLSYAGRHFERTPEPAGERTPEPAGERPPKPSEPRGIPWGELHFRMLDHIAPPSVLVDAEHEILHLSTRAGRYLQFAGGEPSRNLVRLVHPALRIELRAALYEARQSGREAIAPAVRVEIDGQALQVTLRVRAMPELASDLLLVTFSAQAEEELTAPAEARLLGERDPLSGQLERELERVKAQLRETVEQYEASTEELKASNEELQAMNEELRSATEELETSREELQSINEELSTVNQELKGKVDELAHANSDIQNLMDATAIATVFLDRELRIKRFTPPAVSLFNLIPSDINRPLDDLRSPLRYAELGNDARRVLERLVPIEREVSDASGRWYLARLLPYRTLDDDIAGVVLTFVDISERRAAQEALSDSETRLRMVLESVREYAIFWTDPDGRVTGWNSGAERLLQYEAREVIGRPIDIVYTDEDRAAGVPEEEKRLAMEEGRAGDDRFHMRKDGTRFWASGVLRAMRDDEGRVVGLVKILRDETASREAREALERSQAELLAALDENERARAALETASSAKDRFLAVLSHELRTPLTPVITTVQLLARRHDLDEVLRRSLDLIRRNVKVESQLIDDLLDLTRISRGTFEVAREPVDLHAVVRGALEICEDDIAAKAQRLDVVLEARAHETSGDAARLQQVVWNLLRNASKFTPAGGSIGLRSHSEGGRFRLAVTDTGIGIDAAVLPNIFQAFTQAGDWVAREYGGLGLGLAICKATVEAHGGVLSARSGGPGHGSTFVVDLPLEPCDGTQATHPAR